MSTKNKWWGYKHIDGSIQVKRYFDQKDLIEARASGFVEVVFGPFEADTREEALEILDENS